MDKREIKEKELREVMQEINNKKKAQNLLQSLVKAGKTGPPGEKIKTREKRDGGGQEGLRRLGGGQEGLRRVGGGQEGLRRVEDGQEGLLAKVVELRTELGQSWTWRQVKRFKRSLDRIHQG